MPKFGNLGDDEPAPKPAMDEIPAATKGAAASINQSAPYTPSVSVSVGGTTTSASQQLSAEAQLAQIQLERDKWEKEFGKQDEHWMKAFWRPAMGWLYMVICACDFVIFPVISMFLPVMIKMQYVAWKSITLDNGGLIHLAFGAILGITSWTRGQEKLQK